MKNKYEQLAAIIEARIKTGAYAAGSLLPGERVLAREFGIGRVTVRSGLKLLTEKEVIAALNGKGYEVRDPDAGARTRSFFIGGVFAGDKNPVTTALTAAGASGALEDNGYHLIYSSSDLDPRREMRKVRSLLTRKVDGILLMPVYRHIPESNEYDDCGNYERIRDIYDSGMPLVIMDRTYGQDGLPCVGNDDVAGGFMATSYLLDRGHEKVLFLGHSGDRIGRQRKRGYEKAMIETGLEPRFCSLSHIPWQHMSRVDDALCLQETLKVLEDLDGVTGIVTMGAFAGHIAHLVEVSRCPEPELEWTGYDIPPDARRGSSSYAYMRRPMTEIGRRAAQKLMRLIDGDKTAAGEEYLPPKLIAAKTCSPTDHRSGRKEGEPLQLVADC